MHLFGDKLVNFNGKRVNMDRKQMKMKTAKQLYEQAERVRNPDNLPLYPMQVEHQIVQVRL